MNANRHDVYGITFGTLIMALWAWYVRPVSVYELRGMLYAIIGVILVALSVGMFVRAWRRGTHRIGWPVSWNTLSGLFFLTVGIVQLIDAERMFGDRQGRNELRASVVSLVVGAGLSGWLFWRWRHTHDEDGLGD